MSEPDIFFFPQVIQSFYDLRLCICTLHSPTHHSLTTHCPTQTSSNVKAETYDPTAFRTLLDINLTGSFLVSQACARRMIPARTGGSIIFLSSIAGLRVLHPQQQCAYK